MSSSSVTRAPLVETDANTVGSNNLHLFNRGWWSFKGFSVRSSTSRHRTQSETSDENNVFQSRFPLSLIVTACAAFSLASLIAQVGVGPLNKVCVLETHPAPLVHLEFSSTHHCHIFRRSVRSGRVIVNGLTLMETDLPRHHMQLLESEQSDCLPTNVKTPTTVRRTLEIFKEVDMTKSVTRSGRPTLVNTEVNPCVLKQLFSEFGPIVQVRPMVYHCYIAFAIDFQVVDDAVHAKKIFDGEVLRPADAPLPVKLFFPELNDWRLEFSKDITERRVAC